MRRALIDNYAELVERFPTSGAAERLAEHRQLVGSGDFIARVSEVWRGLYRIGDPREAEWSYVNTRYAGDVIVRADDTIERCPN